MAGRSAAPQAGRSADLVDLAPGSAERILRQVAGWLFPGAEVIDAPAGLPEAELLVGLATSTRLLGPLLAAVEAGALDLPDHLAERAIDGHRESMLWCVQVEARMLEVADWFTQTGGVEYLVIKGPAVAHLDEPDPSLRSFADLDLLVHGRDMDRALASLVAHGAARRLPERRAGFDRRFGKSVGLTGPDQIELDVHRTLCAGALGLRIPLDDLFDRPDSFEVGAQRFAAPRLVHRALHAAYHATVGNTLPPLRTQRDLAGYLTHPDLPVEVVVAEARSWGGESVLAEAVRTTTATLGLAIPAWRDWINGYRPDPGDVDLIARSRVDAPWLIDVPMLAEMGWSDRVAFTTAVAFPSKAVLEERGVTRTARVRSGLTAIGQQVRSSISTRLRGS